MQLFYLKQFRHYLILILFQLTLTFFAFPDFYKNGFNASFSNEYDGLKNNYTLIQYVKEPISEKGIFHFQFMNYPEGEYVFTADNTPLIAIPLRYIHHYWFPIADYTPNIFNFFIIFSFIFGSLLLYKLIFYFIEDKNLALISSILVPWILPQLLKLNGHYNLSLYGLFVGMILLCIFLQKHWTNVRLRLIYLGSLILLTVLSFLIHGYYLAIISAFVFAFLILLVAEEYIRYRKITVVFYPILFIFIVAVFAYSIMYYTDGNYQIRDNTALGYDYVEYKLAPSFLYKSYSSQSFRFFIDSNFPTEYFESHQYLGNLGWYGLLSIVILTLCSGKIRAYAFHLNAKMWKMAAMRNVFIASILLLFVALGERFTSIKDTIQLQLPIHFYQNQHIIVLVFSFIAFLSIILLIILAIYNRKKLINISVKSSKKQLYILVSILLFALLTLFSNVLHIGGNLNVLNPFLYIHQVSDFVEHFRAISRFAWPFMIVFYCWLLYMLYHIINVLPRNLKYGLSIMLFFITSTQVVDYILDARKGKNHKNLFASGPVDPFIDSVSKNYDAILPLPFFYVGAEDISVTLDDIDSWSRSIFIIAYQSRLPLVSAKLSRIPIAVANDKLSIFTEGVIPKSLKKKRLLVIINDELLSVENLQSWSDKYADKNVKSVINGHKRFLENTPMTFIRSLNGRSYYEWNAE